MNRKGLGFLLVCTAFAVIMAPITASAQSDGMTYEVYKVELAKQEKRLQETQKTLADCKKAGDDLAKQIADTDAQIAATRAEIYRLVESDQAGIDRYIAELGRIESQLMGLMNLSDANLFDRRDEFDGIKARVQELKKSKIRFLPEAAGKLRNITQLIERIDARMPAKRIKNYTVMKNDSLWKIAKKPDMYDNAYLWPRIYLENRDKIKNPDLIYPNWVLKVPFGVDRGQHLVLQGHSLTQIAGAVYKDPTKWHRIYQANQGQILSPNLIFPAQVLEIPAN